MSALDFKARIDHLLACFYTWREHGVTPADWIELDQAFSIHILVNHVSTNIGVGSKPWLSVPQAPQYCKPFSHTGSDNYTETLREDNYNIHTGSLQLAVKKLPQK